MSKDLWKDFPDYCSLIVAPSGGECFELPLREWRKMIRQAEHIRLLKAVVEAQALVIDHRTGERDGAAHLRVRMARREAVQQARAALRRFEAEEEEQDDD